MNTTENNHQPKKSFLSNLTVQIIIAMLLGAILGIYIHNNHTPEFAKEFSDKIKMLATIFIRLVQMIIAPLVITTLVVGIAKLGDIKSVGRIGGKAMGWFFTASFVSLLIGLFWVNILQPGPGVGGHCIAVDPWFIVAKTPEQARLIRTAREVNDAKPEWVIDQVKIKITEFLQANPSKTIQEVTVACYGLAFKPDIDDLRESPALEITKQLAEQGLNILAIEPNINELPNALVNTSIKLVSINEAAQADIKLILVAHKQFKEEKSIFGNYSINTVLV